MSRKRGHSAAQTDDTDECPVCFEAIDSADHFPCGHATCTTCAARLDRCPICRVDRSGQSQQQQQQERHEQEQRFDAVVSYLMRQIDAERGNGPEIRVFSTSSTIPVHVLDLVASFAREVHAPTRRAAMANEAPEGADNPNNPTSNPNNPTDGRNNPNNPTSNPNNPNNPTDGPTSPLEFSVTIV